MSPVTFRSPRAQRITLLVIVLVLAASARLLTFERFLPFTDYPDELNMYMLALDWRGASLGEAYGASQVGDWLGSYPPLFVWLEMGVQSLMDALNGGRWIASGEVVFWLRLLAVAFGVVTAALIFDTGWLIGGWQTGVLAGLGWALAVPIVEFNSLAIPDPLVYLTCAAAVWGAARAFYRPSFGWALMGFAAALAAIYTKYVPVYALIPPTAALVWLTRRRQPGARRAWIITLVMGIIAAGVLIYTVSLRPLSNSEATAARGRGAERLLDLSRNWENFQTMIAPLSALSLALAAGAVLLAMFPGKRARIDPFIGALILYLLPVVPISAVVSTTGGRAGAEIRHVMPGVIALILLWSAALGLVARRWRKPSRPLGGALAVLSLIVWLIPALLGNRALIERFQPPHVITQLWTWSDLNLPADGLIMMPPNSPIFLTWNRPWSGYDGQTGFQWWLEDPQPAAAPHNYVERGITYFAFTELDRSQLESPDFRAFVDQIQPIKTLQPTTSDAGWPVYVYRLLPPVNPSGILLGDQIELVGYDLTAAAPGQALSLRLYWRAVNQPVTNYSVFVHLTRAGDQQPLAQYDGAPTTPRSLTLQWSDPDEIHISGVINLDVPQDAASTTYALRVGLYDFTTGQRLTTASGADAVEIPLQSH